jgi:acyl carrier protein
LGLDSLEVLQINVARMNPFGVRVQDGKHARRVMRSIHTLADFVQPVA